MDNYLLIKDPNEIVAVADTVRTLSGTSDKMNLNDMADKVDAANMEINEQTTLIEQITTALEGKASGGGGSADPVLQEKTVSPSTSSQTVTPDSGYDGLSKVTVNAMTTVTQATPSITVSSAGLITASATQTAGYVSAGTKSITKQLTTQAAKTITPSTSSQTAVAKDRYTTGAVTVAAIPSTYVEPTATKAATTYTPGTSNQTIAAGTYCSGTQTITGDANLVAENIKSGVSIFGVSGNYTGSGSSNDTNIKTCTVDMTIIDGEENSVCYTTFDNSNNFITQIIVLEDFYGYGSAVLTNVVCGTTITIAPVYNIPFTDYTITGTAKLIYADDNTNMVVFEAPTVANEYCYITS